VTFGGAAASNIVVSSSSSISATTPPHAAGSVSVVVSNPDGQSGTLANGFSYSVTPPPPPAPTVSGISPSSGPISGGTQITISGANFVTGATVSLGGAAASNVTVTSATSISAVTPAHAAGVVNVTVTNPDAQSGTLSNAFTYSAGEIVLLADDFNDNSLNTAKWNASNLFSGFTDLNLPVAETNQRLEIGPLLQNTNDSHYAGIRSVLAYDFTNAYCYVQAVQPASAATAADAMLTIGRDVNGYYRIFTEGSSLIFQKRIGGTKVTLLSAPYNTANDRYWRIRHEASSGNVIFETAPDNGGVPGAWSARFSEPWNTSAVPLGAILFEIKGGTWRAESSAPGKVIFDNFKAAKP
ncbi:MAG: IPT/TIG domain-containing protein, partial [Blastocatellia bacterium]